jgi:hypothetical protein
MSKGLPCRICSSPPDVLAAVNQRLQARTPFRQLARETGFSAAALFRHGKKHVPQAALAAHREQKQFLANLQNCRHVIYYPTGIPGTECEGKPFLSVPTTNLQQDDLIVLVEYAPAVAPRIYQKSQAEDPQPEPSETTA